LDSALASWSKLPVTEVQRVAQKAGFALDTQPFDQANRPFRNSLSRLVSLATQAGAATVDDLRSLMIDVPSKADPLADLVIESKKRGFTPLGEPCDVVVLSVLLARPELRVRAAVPFRTELEAAMDVVIRRRDSK
jgi:hypothetical protein